MIMDTNSFIHDNDHNTHTYIYIGTNDFSFIQMNSIQ